MSKIAVTGANGMMGRHMTSLLKSKGIFVNEVTREEWDLTEWKSFNDLDNIFGSVSTIFHFGAQLLNNEKKNDNWQTQQTFDANTRSCLNLAEWATLRNIPIVFLSSSVVYKNPHALKILETDPKVVNGFGGFYGYSKLLAENIFRHFSLEGLNCVILRPSSIYGYGLPPIKLVQNYIDLASSGSDLRVTEHKNKINLIHAYDVASAAFSAVNRKSWGIFNLSSKVENTIFQIAETAVSISDVSSKIILGEHINGSVFTRFNLDSTLAKKSFGFETEIDLKEGMQLMKQRKLGPCRISNTS